MTLFADPTNDDRADRIPPTLQAYATARGDADDEESDLSDVLTDLMHYAKREGYDFPALLTTAEMNFTEEVEEGG